MKKMMKLYHFIKKCNWHGRNFSSEKNDWVKFEEKLIQQLRLICHMKKKRIYAQLIFQNKIQSMKNKSSFYWFLMEKNWHYLAVTKLSALLRGIALKHHTDFYFLNCFYSFTTENKLKFHEKVCFANPKK